MNRAPAFQFYAGDWIKSRSVRLMDSEQRGWYIQLLAEAWDGNPQCMLPKDDATLQTLAGVNRESKTEPAFNGRWTFVKGMFTDRGEYLANERQLECLAEQMRNRENAVKAGLASAKKREDDRKDKQRLLAQIVTQSNGRSTDVQRKSNTPTPTPTSTSTPVCNTVTEPVDFDLFWQAYPKKRAKDEALKAWKKKKNRPPIAQILQAIKDQKASEQWRKNGGEFIPHPATWINQGRWDDVVGIEEEPRCKKCGWEVSKCTCEDNIPL